MYEFIVYEFMGLWCELNCVHRCMTFVYFSGSCIGWHKMHKSTPTDSQTFHEYSICFSGDRYERFHSIRPREWHFLCVMVCVCMSICVRICMCVCVSVCVCMCVSV